MLTGEAQIPGGKSRLLLGRNLQVTECETDPDFASKVLKIQREICPGRRHADFKLQQKEDHNAGQTALESPNDETSTGTSVEPCAESHLKCQNDERPQLKHEDLLLESPTPDSDVVEADGSCFSSPSRKDSVETSEENLIRAHVQDLSVDENSSILFTNNKVNRIMDQKETMNDKFTGENLNNIEKVFNNSMSISSSEDAVDNKKDFFPVHKTVSSQDENSKEPITSEVSTSADSMRSVSNKISLNEYSLSEWRGTTENAQYMRLGYSQILEVTGCSSLRKIRGDNYCGLRATCFQILSQNLKVFQAQENFKDILLFPHTLKHTYGCNWLTHWSFAGRLRATRKKKLETLYECLKCFCHKLEKANSIVDSDARVEYFLTYFNSDEKEEVLLFEALKLLMLHSAVLLYEDAKAEKKVPEFSYLLFARDTSENPEQLMKNHLNSVGGSGGLEQVEMFLLGYALNLTIRVVRPSKVESEDFLTFYPDDHKEEWDMCNLIAEDDRHYNIIVP